MNITKYDNKFPKKNPILFHIIFGHLRNFGLKIVSIKITKVKKRNSPDKMKLLKKKIIEIMKNIKLNV
tara:strand:- start:154 stop:357 length:204 start_codon:yes stop_codon:yes gene_type:complete